LQAAGNVIPLYYLQTYSVSVLDYSRSTGSLLLSLNSGVNSLSRIAMGTLADFVGRQNTMIASVSYFLLSSDTCIDSSISRFTSQGFQYLPFGTTLHEHVSSPSLSSTASMLADTMLYFQPQSPKYTALTTTLV
jgi:MFS family permease